MNRYRHILVADNRRPLPYSLAVVDIGFEVQLSRFGEKFFAWYIYYVLFVDEAKRLVVIVGLDAGNEVSFFLYLN